VFKAIPSNEESPHWAGHLETSKSSLPGYGRSAGMLLPFSTGFSRHSGKALGIASKMAD